MTPDEMIEAMARTIARGLGDEYANALKNKQRWVAKRGMSGGRFRDINEPFRSDYDDAARAALSAILPVLRDEVLGLGCPLCGGDCASANPPVISCWVAAIRARFDAMANEVFEEPWGRP